MGKIIAEREEDWDYLRYCLESDSNSDSPAIQHLRFQSKTLVGVLNTGIWGVASLWEPPKQPVDCFDGLI